jgi:hypothetical protein
MEAVDCLDGVDVYEYPVWFWFHWPWVACPLNNRRDLPGNLINNVKSVFRLLRYFRSGVYIGDVLEDKRVALDAYKSQMTRLVDDPGWAVLEDVADGEFLARFFARHELFWLRVAVGEGQTRGS